MTPLKTSAELKACAKEHLFGKYGTVISANLLMYLIVFAVDLFLLLFIDTTTTLGTILYYILAFGSSLFFGFFTAGIHFFNLKLVCGQPIVTSDLFFGFRTFQKKTLQVQLWISILNYAAMLPSIVLSVRSMKNGGLYTQSSYEILLYTVAMLFSEAVSIFIQLFYAQTFYLMFDFPQYTSRELLSISRKMMKGQKGRLFYLYVSFLPLFLLSLLSCGIALLWLVPYVNATLAEFYMDLVGHSKSSTNC